MLPMYRDLHAMYHSTRKKGKLQAAHILGFCFFAKALSFTLEHKFAQSVLNTTVKTAFLTCVKFFKIYFLMWTVIPLGTFFLVSLGKGVFI